MDLDTHSSNIFIRRARPSREPFDQRRGGFCLCSFLFSIGTFQGRPGLALVVACIEVAPMEASALMEVNDG